MAEIIPGINEQDKHEFERKLDLCAPYVSTVQIDIMDGVFVKSSTIRDTDFLRDMVSRYPRTVFEAHLMVDRPHEYVSPLARAGFKRLIAHVESEDPRKFLDEIQYEDVEVGMAIDAMTEFELIEPYLELVDTILVMTVEMGASGQPFLAETMEKVKLIHDGYPDLPIEVDGGINTTTARIAKDSGATRIVSTSYLFRKGESLTGNITSLDNA